jgi:transcription elongation factor Elf1
MNIARKIGTTLIIDVGTVFNCYSCNSCGQLFHSKQDKGLIKCGNCHEEIEIEN